MLRDGVRPIAPDRDRIDQHLTLATETKAEVEEMKTAIDGIRDVVCVAVLLLRRSLALCVFTSVVAIMAYLSVCCVFLCLLCVCCKGREMWTVHMRVCEKVTW